MPLLMRHPSHTGSAGKECLALTSHLDITPTILGLAGVSDDKRQATAPKLHGHDLSGVLASPDSAKANAVRDGALYNYNMWLYQDADFMRNAFEILSAGKKVGEAGLKPDLTKRGSIRSITDGRYRYSRYFSPLQHNRPGTVEQVFDYNDVELYDLEADPHEMRNLAVDRRATGELLLAMNQKLIDVIDEEVGSDDGEFLPENKTGWAVTRFDP